jgi:hypothetical protein
VEKHGEEGAVARLIPREGHSRHGLKLLRLAVDRQDLRISPEWVYELLEGAS